MFAIEIRAYDGTWYKVKRDGVVKTFERKGDAMYFALGDLNQRGGLVPLPKPGAWRVTAA